MSCSDNGKGAIPNQIEQFLKYQDYYNDLVPDNFPKLDLSDSLYSAVLWNAPGEYSYIINSNTIYDGKKNIQEKTELVYNGIHSLYRFQSKDSEVWTPFVSTESDLKGNVEYIQLSFYDPYFYTSVEENSPIDYLPVLMHEMAHMTERSTPQELLDTTSVGVFELISHFDTDSIFRKLLILENNQLLKALAAPKEELSIILQDYFLIQNKRKSESPPRLMSVEPEIEASEGFGRYIEYLCKMKLDSISLNKLVGFEEFVPEYALESEPWMTDMESGNAYMYTTGFNKIKLLRKHQGDDFIKIYSSYKKHDLDIYLRELMND